MKRAALFACLAAWLAAGLAGWLADGLASAGSARAGPPPQRIALGDLTFHYRPEAWHIAPAGDGLAATCLLADCRGAVLDIARRDGEAGCTRAAMLAQTERLFTAQGRAYANIYPAGRFALVLAARHDGPTPSFPEYVHGCLAWQGGEYRFAMRPETVGTQAQVGGALHRLVSEATAPAARVERLRLGAVDFAVSTETWTMEDAGGGNLRLACRMPACREPGLTATLSVHRPPQSCPALDDGIDRLEGSGTRIETLAADAPGGLDITVSERFLGCRNLMPPGFDACAVDDGRSYHLSAFTPVNCHAPIGRIPRDLLIGLMRDARIAGR